MLAVHFGAGNIGRGFIGTLLDQAGYETIFVDVNDQIINALNDKQAYEVILAGGGQTIQVKNVSGLNSMTQEVQVIEAIEKADLITTAIGPHILPKIAPLLAKALKKRFKTNEAPINVIACENMIGGSSLLKKHVEELMSETEELNRLAGFPNAGVDRIVPIQNHDDPLTVEVEPFYEWVVETSEIKGEPPAIEGVTYVEDLTPFIERKLFTVNTGHAAAAYIGRKYGYETIQQAMQDEKVVEKVRGALQETGAVLAAKYNFNKEEHQAYITKILDRFTNPSMTDEVTRVGRGPIRKLGSQDRLIRPALDYLEWIGEAPVYLPEVIAAALAFDDSNDEEARELQNRINENGAIETLKEVSQLADEHLLVQLVEKHIES
ncbi:mannitol-1-phosphate 5-dehydrogenase [Halobacillus sp. Marseille-Q1614]|uniref:mannitol-1-phosphate 5-dehydrogenase n=1 Tax=Halobacillus sp. Marseille-Q1614 TaxID=2709134 RepID=UPI0015709946|nr:mannitol-1-phosphate 5-dehydrogenase [Halobacillus sp. Marseille-Q1614]